ncbi:response regulator [Anaerolineales bacterium HSG6]|nr:response regulator [Anaerolineales bacterium HSG6]MDM8529816.1 response regulator [Anaerolineales bacterium HSG25]
MLTNYKVLVVDDEDVVRSFCVELLRLEGAQVTGAPDGSEALSLLGQHDFELILLDLSMPGISGLQVLEQVSAYYPHISVIMMTGYGTLEAAVTAQDLGVEGFILKPFDDKQLLTIIARIIERRQLRQNYARLQAHMPLLALSHRLMVEQDIKKLAQSVLQIIQREIKMQAASLWLLSSQVEVSPVNSDQPFILLAMLGQPLHPPQNNDAIAAWVVLDSGAGETTELQKAKTLHFRLQSEERQVGWLCLSHQKAGFFTQRDIEFLRVMSSHLTVGLENRNLYYTINLARQEWETIFNTIHDGILVHNASKNGQVTRINQTLATWLDQPSEQLLHQSAKTITVDADGLSLLDIAAPLLADSMLANHPSIIPLSMEFNSPPWAENQSFRIRTYPLWRGRKLVEIVHIIEDVTQAVRVQAQMVQTEKLSALGRLSASLAHEINNPLQALQSGLRLLGRPNLSDKKRVQYVEMMRSEVERLVKLTGQTLDFARPSRVGKEPVNLNKLLHETLTLVNKQVQRYNITCSFTLHETLPIIYAVPGQIKQVFLNLILNAVDAMPDGGILEFATCYTVDDKYAVVGITDNGPGISSRYLNRISEPFFTTKEQGTGLGLSISYSIVEAHGGYIEVRTSSKKGCRFLIYLPVDLEEAHEIAGHE